MYELIQLTDKCYYIQSPAKIGLVKLNDGSVGSVTIGGAVSPAGGNFEEPVTQATLKVVGAFLGLSRDRSSARRFPAIHPLESWSHYKSIVDAGQISFARSLLRRGQEVNQMMKVVGEEGTNTDDFVIYLKSEFLDFVYLQQNTFDEVDAACSEERQKYCFSKVCQVLDTKFQFDSKDTARRFFQELQLIFTDWNYMPFGSDEFKQQEEVIASKIQEKACHA